jgi:2-polyprenyl-6-hydroxyphenyl methylase/3-demethylubiquinone-9 3-methyltransferase
MRPHPRAIGATGNEGEAMLEKGIIEGILAHYPHASAFQRWHMRGRLRLCPYDGLLKHLTGKGNLLDIGCGFGHFAWYLRQVMPELAYFGTDIDERKIELALGCPDDSSRPLPSFRKGDVMAMEDWQSPYGNIVLLDVTYLMPWELQARLLEWALGSLAAGAESALVLKTMDVPQGWSGRRTVWEEWIMVRLLRRTRSSGTLNGVQPFATYIDFARQRGFRCEVESMGTFNPSSVLRFHR